MLDEKTIRQLVIMALVGILLVVTALLIKPIFMPIVFGLVLAYTFNPLNKLLLRKIKNKTWSALITCFLVLIILFVSIWFLIPILTHQFFDAYMTVQSLDIVGSLKKILPFLFTSQKISSNVAIAYNTFIANAVKVVMEKLTEMIVDLPALILKSLLFAAI